MRTVLVFGFTQGATYGMIGGIPTAANFGPWMPHAGQVVNVTVNTSDGGEDGIGMAYSATGTASSGRFTDGDPISAAYGLVKINGTTVNLDIENLPAIPVGGFAFMTVTLEFDD